MALGNLGILNLSAIYLKKVFELGVWNLVIVDDEQISWLN